jgi:hypothetical protein
MCFLRMPRKAFQNTLRSLGKLGLLFRGKKSVRAFGPTSCDLFPVREEFDTAFACNVELGTPLRIVDSTKGEGFARDGDANVDAYHTR